MEAYKDKSRYFLSFVLYYSPGSKVTEESLQSPSWKKLPLEHHHRYNDTPCKSDLKNAFQLKVHFGRRISPLDHTFTDFTTKYAWKACYRMFETHRKTQASTS